MKRIKYRQYYYGGEYSEEEMQIPEECCMYEVEQINTSYHIEDTDDYTKTYVLLSPVEFEDSVLLGNIYFSYMDAVFITNSEIPVLSVESAPQFNEVYSVEYYSDRELASELMEDLSDFDIEELIDAKKKCEKISSLCKFRKLTRTGIEVSNVTFLNYFDGEELNSMSIITLPYSNIPSENIVTNMSELFLSRTKEIYEKITNY